tara:strand:+ start:492 stop:758 length:267 start_codon:yes stop_codon:yes gene_type:complete
MKLKKLLKETKAWERKFGESLPTLKDTSKAYKLKQEQEVNEEPIVENNAAIKKQSIQLVKDMKKFGGRMNQYQIAYADKLLSLLKKLK